MDLFTRGNPLNPYIIPFPDGWGLKGITWYAMSYLVGALLALALSSYRAYKDGYPKDFFINLYRLELRKKEREIGKTMVGIVTVSAYDLREISEEESVKIVEDIGPVVDKYMRKYDVITKLNKNQFAFMMFNSSEEMIKRINQRMNFLLNQVKKKHRILFTLSCKPIQATDENYNETAF